MGTDTHGLMLNGKKKETQATDIAQSDSICLKNKMKKKNPTICIERNVFIFLYQY